MTSISGISGIELATRQGHENTSGEPLERTLFSSSEVNSNALLALDRSLSQQDKSDVAASFLFGQLAANAAADKFHNPELWTKKMLDTLSGIGWSVVSESKTSPSSITAPFDWSGITMNAFNKAYGSASKLMAGTVEAATAQPAGSAAAQLWNTNTLDDGNGIYLLGLSELDQEGEPKLSVLTSSFSLTTGTTGILAWASQADMATQFAVLVLNLDVYSKVRKQILERLGDRIRTEIAPI
ncbi:hypothetical protein [Roseibium sp. RKSG952]|uniref:hypothetical protein n=1 Tax=Roseibium sp. RKSG952 TaxID=2529384 RepID=UPI0012BCEB81|nr:hypothetical protein [Roseibium sp. RKSG952]MTH96091.1 hypothetical protein [Roseibium sp. RKSG952]